MSKKWVGVLAVEGVMTGDGRIMAEGALSWAGLPLPLAWLQAQQHGDGSGNAGAIDLGNIGSIERAGADVNGSGVIDDSSDAGAEFVRKLAEGTAPLGDRWGLSVDLSDTVVELIDTRPEDDTAEGDEGGPVVLAAGGRTVFTLTGAAALSAWRSPRTPHAMWAALTAAAGDPLPEGSVVVDEPMDMDRFVMRLVSGTVRGVTACQIAAFEGATLTLDTDDTAEVADVVEPVAVTAAASFPLHPPRSWFVADAPESDDDARLVPQYDMETGAYIGLAVPLTITAEGRVFGQLAPANRCHTAMSVCITAPDSPSAYSHFMLGVTECDDGNHVETGTLVIGCDHAPHSMTMGQARDHYAHTGMEWADVRVAPNRYGPWFSGSLRPNVTDELLRTVRAGGVSGDWRGANGALELMAIQAVPVPGFPVQRIRPLAASATIEVHEWSPSVSVVGDEVSISTPPIQRAVVASAAPCGCGAMTAAHGDDNVMLTEVHLMLRSLMLRTDPLKDAAKEALRARITGGRG